MSERSDVLFQLYMDELRRLTGVDSNDLTLLFSEIADERGEVDADILNSVESKAVARYNAEHRWRLGALTDDDWEEFGERIWRESGAAL